MCGICGIVSPSGVKTEELYQMLSSIKHRGPDDEGIYLKGMIGLGSRRLSIIDVDGGKQPISNEDKTIWIVFNGEIYNYKQLRHDLENKGHVFRTQSDTEVIIHLYEEYGDYFVTKLNGMFAFSIWDQRSQRLLLARDRIGQKPIYYAQEGSRFYFGSEIKAILAVCQKDAQIDYESLHYYLSLRFIPPPKTFFNGIYKIPPAHFLVLQENKISINRYWDLSFIQKSTAKENELLEGLQHHLRQSILSHMVSDVPVGAFLSGGLDSSMIVAILTKDLQFQLQTFAIGVEETDFNELPYADLVAKDCRTQHYEECVAPDLIQLLPKMIWHLDEPSDPIAACMFHAARLASKYVKVVLGGDGGDELFAGFDRYKGNDYIQAYRLIPEILRLKLLGPLLDLAPDSFTYKSLTQKMRWVHQLSMMPNPGREFAEATCFFRFSHSDKEKLYSPSYWKRMSGIDAADVIVDNYNHNQASETVDRMLFADFMTRLPEHSLMLTDRMTMAHGLEARSPFLDHELVEYLATFPSSLKIRDGETKYILRKLAEHYLPKVITRREKQGFIFPIAYWFRNELYPFLQNVLLNSHYVKQGIFQKGYIQTLLEEHRGNKTDHHVRLWMLLNIEIWHKIFIEQKHYTTVQEDFNG